MDSVKAIETSYDGHRFRSRLEARWAVFFNHLGIRWLYEPQGYLIGDPAVTYLPDFRLPDLDLWVEVKGDNSRMNWKLLGDAVDPIIGSILPSSTFTGFDYRWGCGFGGAAVLVLSNIPHSSQQDLMPYHLMVVNRKGAQLIKAYFDGAGDVHTIGDGGYLDYYDPSWRVESWTPKDRSGRLVNIESPMYFRKNFEHPTQYRKLIWAYEAARTARFEHGETPS